MKVGLFAPLLAPEFGGVWQFTQWVVDQVGPVVPMHLLLPEALLREVSAGRVTSSTVVEELLTEVRRSLAYRLLEEWPTRPPKGVRVPFYGKLARWVRRGVYGGSVEAPALIRDLEAHGVDVVHVPYQVLSHQAVARVFPYVINPHDYQHEHFPEFFTDEQLSRRRNVSYPCQRKAAAVVVHSLQTRDDALRFLQIPEERVFYAPYGPLSTFPDMDEEPARQAAAHLKLPGRFAFYPARMWPHKNHLGLLEAVAALKRKGIEVNCIFTDASGEHGAAVMERAAALGLEGQVRAVGRVSPEEMGALYRLCTMVVVPSRFEQNSGPMLEAIHFGKAVAVSHLPELVASLDGAGLVFDPESPDEIAAAIDRLWSSDANRKEAEEKVRRRKAAMSWEPFVQAYRDAYAYALARGPAA